MRLSVSRSKNSASLYVIKSIFVEGVNSSKIVEKLGTEEELRKRYPHRDPYEWARDYIAELNRREKEENKEIITRFASAKRIPEGEQVRYNGGYLFLQTLYHELGLHRIFREIQDRHAIEFDLNDILAKLVYTRILEPSSKRSSFEAAQTFLESPSFDLHHIYRALDVVGQEADTIQAAVYRNSTKVVKRNTKILYYDCTNYFFEIEEASGLKQYGQSKEHKPNPLVQMGLFLDGSGFPLAFSIHPGNTNEQTTLRPLEQKILKDFELSKFIVCTDAGLSSLANRQWNNVGERAFIVTQSLKKLKGHLREWALDPNGWALPGSKKMYDLSAIDDTDEKEYDNVYYKSRWIHEDGLEQQLIVTFSPKYKQYQQTIRERQVERARMIVNKPSSLKAKRATDPKRFVASYPCTKEGELAEEDVVVLDTETIGREARYDGFYAVCTNLEGDPLEVIAVNRGRWAIEAAFRVMKTEFRARPVYLSRDNRILAHFLICFLALFIYKMLEKKIRPMLPKQDPSGATIVDTLRGMDFYEIKGDGYVPLYMRTPLTDALHDQFGFHTDTQIVTRKMMRQIIRKTRK